MGVVDLACGPDGTEVALKALTFHGSEDDIARARQRIEREAEVLSHLVHPNIVPLLDVLRDNDEITLVMPYLTGGTLADRIARHGPLNGERFEQLADDLSGALAAAHRAGVVHRDLKPADVFALGATLLFAATGEGPYGRGAPDLLMVRAAQGKVQPVPRSLPSDLRRRLRA